MAFKTIIKDVILIILAIISGFVLLMGFFGEVEELYQIIYKILYACVGFIGLVLTTNNTSFGKKFNK